MVRLRLDRRVGFAWVSQGGISKSRPSGLRLLLELVDQGRRQRQAVRNCYPM